MKKFVMVAALAFTFLVSGVNANAAIDAASVQALVSAGIITQDVANQLLGTTTSSATTGAYVYSGGLLKVGSRGTQVYNLQKCLAELKNNSTSNIDGIFGSKTKAAVMLFQSQNGLAVDGIVGPMTGPKYSVACAKSTVATTPTTPTTTSDDKEFVLGGEGEVSAFTIDKEDDAMASSKEHIATVEFDVEDGDVQLDKVELFFEEVTTVNDLWDNIERVKLMMDGKEIADVKVDDDDDWKDEGTSAASLPLYSLSFRGSEVIKEDETGKVEVVIVTTDEVESGDADEVYNLWAELRFVDADGNTSYEGEDESYNSTGSKDITFKIEPLGAFGIDFDESKNSPEDNEALDLSSDIDGETLVIVDVEIDDEQDGVLEKAEVKVGFTFAANANDNTTAKNVDTDELLSKLSFMIDGKEIDTDDAKAAVTFAAGSCAGADTTAGAGSPDTAQPTTESACLGADVTPGAWTSAAPAALTGATAVKFTFDLDDIDVDAEEEMVVTIKGDFSDIEDDSVFVGTKVKVESVSLSGEDSEGNNFGPLSENTSTYAPFFTATAGDIELDFNGDLELLYSSDHVGVAKFEVKVSNNTGSDLTGMATASNWTFDIEGLTGGTVLVYDADEAIDGTPGAAVATISDGDDESYIITIGFSADSNKDAEITIEEIAAENIAVSAKVSE